MIRSALDGDTCMLTELDGHDFTVPTREAAAQARLEAYRLRSVTVEPEHVLLALMRLPGVLAPVLASLNIRSDELKSGLESILKPNAECSASRRVPYSEGCRQALARAISESAALGDTRVGPEHLLLGLIPGCGTEVTRLLDDAGITTDTIRAFISARVSERAGGLHVTLDVNSDVSFCDQITARLQEAILSRRLQPHERLPAIRGLADRLDVAPGTVARAYQELERRGLIVTDGARGSRVAALDPNAQTADRRNLVIRSLLEEVVRAAARLGSSADEVRRALDAILDSVFRQPGQPRARPD